MFKVGDRVRLSQTARKNFLTGGDSGPHVEVARNNCSGVILEQVGVRGRHQVIAYRVNFDGVEMIVPEEELIKDPTNGRIMNW